MAIFLDEYKHDCYNVIAFGGRQFLFFRKVDERGLGYEITTTFLYKQGTHKFSMMFPVQNKNQFEKKWENLKIKQFYEPHLKTILQKLKID